MRCNLIPSPYAINNVFSKCLDSRRIAERMHGLSRPSLFSVIIEHRKRSCLNLALLSGDPWINWVADAQLHCGASLVQQCSSCRHHFKGRTAWFLVFQANLFRVKRQSMCEEAALAS